MDYIVKHENDEANLSKGDHNFRLAEIIIRIGTTKITTQILECSLCEKNFYLGHTAAEHFLMPVSTGENTDTASEVAPANPAPTTISDIDDDYDTVDNNVLETSGSLVYQPEQPECPSTPVVIDAIDGTNFEPPPPEPIPTLFEAPEPELVLAKDVSSIYQCLVCAASFDSLDRFEAHSLECRNTLARLDNQEHIVGDPTVCDKLPPTTDDDVKLEIAANKKTDLLCTTCGLKFKTAGKLKKHIKVHKTEKRRRKLVCEICKRVLADRASMEQHMDIHLEKKNFKCTFCGRLFRQKNNLIRHTRIHTGEKPHLCTICGKGFYDKTDLTRHFRVHTGEKPYKCDVCPSTFSTPGKLKGHRNTHSGEANVQCPVCLKKLSCNYTLKSHMIIHTGESNSVCTVCNKVFAKNHKLKRHMMTHTGEKPFVCPTCGNRFRNRYNMSEHMKIHDREKVKQEQRDHAPHQLVADEATPVLLLEPSLVDVTSQILDGDVEHRIHLPAQHGIKIGILKNNRKLDMDGDYIEINYEDIQLGLPGDLSAEGVAVNL